LGVSGSVANRIESNRSGSLVVVCV
jgi:hypothetical protein